MNDIYSVDSCYFRTISDTAGDLRGDAKNLTMYSTSQNKKKFVYEGCIFKIVGATGIKNSKKCSLLVNVAW